MQAPETDKKADETPADLRSQPKKKLPQRKCVGCGESKNKSELIRIVRAPDGSVSLDFTGKKSGRGAYLCRNPACLKKARKSGRIEKNLSCTINDEVYAALETELNGNGTNGTNVR